MVRSINSGIRIAGYQNSEKQFFEELFIDEKGDVKLEKHPLVAEIENVRKAILTFLIAALPLEVAFQMLVHFSQR